MRTPGSEQHAPAAGAGPPFAGAIGVDNHFVHRSNPARGESGASPALPSGEGAGAACRHDRALACRPLGHRRGTPTAGVRNGFQAGSVRRRTPRTRFTATTMAHRAQNGPPALASVRSIQSNRCNCALAAHDCAWRVQAPAGYSSSQAAANAAASNLMNLACPGQVEGRSRQPLMRPSLLQHARPALAQGPHCG